RLRDFAVGTQMSEGRDTARGMREATRYFVELSHLGAKIDYVDVGGGLGVDYEGTRSRSYNSVNYGVAQYASSIVQPLADACAANGLAQPRIVTECGRAMRSEERRVGTEWRWPWAGARRTANDGTWRL